jgi:hypothetical protein
MDIQEVRTAPQSPWQNGDAERVIGSIRRECLDSRHRGQREGASSRADCVRRRRHALAHTSRPRQGHTITRPTSPLSAGRIVATPKVGGLHHGYDRIAA